MAEIVAVYKPQGLTPLQILNKYRNFNNLSTSQKISYSGRLDPMAHGIQLLVIDPDKVILSVAKSFEKEYLVTFLFGCSTDTFDLLGKITAISNINSKISLQKISTTMSQIFFGDKNQEYPEYSSKNFQGKSLHEWSRLGLIDSIPKLFHQISIYSCDIVSFGEISTEKIQEKLSIISDIKGDFRQAEIINDWNNLLSKNSTSSFEYIKVKLRVSSGTYMRSLAKELSQITQIPCLAMEIERTKVGNYTYNECINL